MIIGIWSDKELMISSIIYHYNNRTIEKVYKSDEMIINWVETYEFFPIAETEDSREMFSKIKDAYEYHCKFVLEHFSETDRIFNYNEYGLGTWDMVIRESLSTFYPYSDKAKVLLKKMVAVRREYNPDFTIRRFSAKLNRFIHAQNFGSSQYGTETYSTALEEVRNGLKKTHWIWYIFPQMKGLGNSELSDYYGINGREEAKAYIANPILKQRLIEITEAVYNSDKSVYEIFGNDAIKVRSCMLLFASVSDEPIFKKMISKYCWR